VASVEQRIQELEDINYLIRDFSRRNEFSDATSYAQSIVGEYKAYLNKYAREEVDDLPSGRDYSDDEDAIVYKYKTECKGKRNLNTEFQGLYKDVINYNNTLKTMYKRDIKKLSKNRNTMNELYANEQNWLRNIKTQAHRHKYSFL
jgi:hypothetical protein